MKERPILFSGPMVQAILEGRKTMTRRAVSLRNVDDIDDTGTPQKRGLDGVFHPAQCPYGKPGDRLWVRETWRSKEKYRVAYRADGECGAFMGDGGGGRIWNHHGWLAGIAEQSLKGRWWGPECYGEKWRPSIFMPRCASRITLEVTAVRVEQLNSISETDAQAEGCEWTGEPGIYGDGCVSPLLNFEELWDSINGKRPGSSWADDPWVWVVEFKRI